MLLFENYVLTLDGLLSLLRQPTQAPQKSLSFFSRSSLGSQVDLSKKNEERDLARELLRGPDTGRLDDALSLTEEV